MSGTGAGHSAAEISSQNVPRWMFLPLPLPRFWCMSAGFPRVAQASYNLQRCRRPGGARCEAASIIPGLAAPCGFNRDAARDPLPVIRFQYRLFNNAIRTGGGGVRAFSQRRREPYPVYERARRTARSNPGLDISRRKC